MNYLSMLILFLGVMLTGIIMSFIKLSTKTTRMLLTFSGAFLLTLAFTKIIPDIFSDENSQQLGYIVLIGFFTQIIIEYFSGGVDHGHIHSRENNKSDHGHAIINPYALLIGVGLHSFFEGMPFSGEFQQHADVQNYLLLGIVFHNVPIAIVLMSLFLQAGYSKIKSLALISIFALAAPLGSLASLIAGNFFANTENYYGVIMAFVVGIFLHISTIILFESDKSHKFNFYKFLTILIGIAVAIVITKSH